MNNYTIIAYTMEGLSFIFRDPAIKKYPIKRIILFGSTARGELGKEGDIDLFIDIPKDIEKIFNKEVKRAVKKFYSSSNFKKWQMRGITNPFSIKAGYLDEWKLKKTVLTEGILLYGKPLAEKLERKILFIIKPIKEIVKRNKVIRKLFGRKEKTYSEEGLVSKFNGEKLSPRIFFVPESTMPAITSFLAQEKVEFRMIEVWV